MVSFCCISVFIQFHSMTLCYGCTRDMMLFRETKAFLLACYIVWCNVIHLYSWWYGQLSLPYAFDLVIGSYFSTDLYWFIKSFLNPWYIFLLTWFQINPLSSLPKYISPYFTGWVDLSNRVYKREQISPVSLVLYTSSCWLVVMFSS